MQQFSLLLGSLDAEAEAATAVPVCGGRRFRRIFSKRDFPLLGEEEKAEPAEEEHIWISAHSK